MDAQQQHNNIPSFKEQLVMVQQCSPGEWAEYANAYPRPSKAVIYLNDDSKKADFELHVPLHLVNEVLAVVLRNADHKQTAHAALVIEGHVSAGVTSVNGLKRVSMGKQTYDVVSDHLRPVEPASGSLETLQGKDAQSRHPGKSIFHDRVDNHLIPFFRRSDETDDHIILLTGYPKDTHEARKELKTKESGKQSAVSMATFWDSKIKTVLAADHGEPKRAVDYNHSAVRPHVDYHAIFYMVHASHSQSYDFPSGLAAPRNIRSRLKAIHEWAGAAEDWRYAQGSGTNEQKLPVEHIRIEEAELLRIVGSGKPDSNDKWGKITDEALKMLCKAHLDFLLKDPIVIHPFWEGAQLYEYLLKK